VHPTGGSLRVFRHFSWLEVDSVKVALPRLAHQRVTRAVGRYTNTMKRFSLFITLLLTCAIAFGVLVFLDSLFDRRETKTNRFSQFYSIEPKSLLDTLEEGNVDAFAPIVADESPFLPPDQQIPVTWTQEDYLRIADALFTFLWDDGLDSWQLNSMSFDLNCTDFSIGLQEGDFTFFKNQQASDAETRLERFIRIDPRNKYIYIAEYAYYPKLANWSSIDLKNNKFSASKILQIADKAGAKAKRESVENACDIHLLLAPGSPRYDGWQIYFRRADKDRTKLLYVEVDPFTGETSLP
jgi:hypothetical protein